MSDNKSRKEQASERADELAELLKRTQSDGSVVEKLWSYGTIVDYLMKRIQALRAGAPTLEATDMSKFPENWKDGAKHICTVVYDPSTQTITYERAGAPSEPEVNPLDCTCEYAHRSSYTCPSRAPSQGAIKDVAPTDRNAPSEPNLLHLADLAQANAIEQCAVEAGERSPEGVSSHTMLGDMWDRRIRNLRIRNLRAAKPGNAASSELQDCDLCHMSPMITEQENGYHVSKITGSRFKCVANSAKPGNVAEKEKP